MEAVIVREGADFVSNRDAAEQDRRRGPVSTSSKSGGKPLTLTVGVGNPKALTLNPFNWLAMNVVPSRRGAPALVDCQVKLWVASGVAALAAVMVSV